MRLFIVMLCLAVSTSAFSQAPLKNIVVLGSSSAYGYFGSPPLYPYDSSMAGRLSKFYKDAHMIDNLYNLSQISTNVFQGMPSWYDPTKDPRLATYNAHDLSLLYVNTGKNVTAALALNPDVILVYFPTNNYDWIAKNDVMFAFRTIKATADSAGVPLFILSTQPRGNLSPSEHLILMDLRDSIQNAFGSRAIMIYNQVANPADMRYMNPELWLGYPDHLGTSYMDSVHMNNVGQRIVFNQVLAADIFGQGAALPVRLLNFSGLDNASGNLLKWTVSNEIDFSGFEIERSTDGINYLKIGFVSSSNQASAGGSYKYQFQDKNLTGTKIYYRLKEIDNNGGFKYSQVLTMNKRVSGGFSIITSYPNPVTGTFTIIFNSLKTESVILSVKDETGRLIIRQSVNADIGSNSLPLNVSSLKSGNYFLTLYSESEGKSLTGRFIKL